MINYSKYLINQNLNDNKLNDLFLKLIIGLLLYLKTKNNTYKQIYPV
jgi:hypothetical protein